MNFFSDPDPQQRYFADPNLIQSRIQIHSTAVSQWFLFVWLGSNNILGDPSGPVYHLVSGSYTLQCKSRLKTPAIQAIWSILVWHVRLADEWMNWMNEWMNECCERTASVCSANPGRKPCHSNHLKYLSVVCTFGFLMNEWMNWMNECCEWTASVCSTIIHWRKSEWNNDCHYFTMPVCIALWAWLINEGSNVMADGCRNEWMCELLNNE